MKFRLSLFILLLICFSSCRHRNIVVEQTWPDGSPKRICIYLGHGDNKVLMKETYYYQNKKIQVEGEYKHSQRDGKWTYYYESGKIWSDGYFKNGKNDGRRTTYYPNGKVRYEANYREDKRIGIWKFYDETGRLVKSVNYSKSGNSDIQDLPAGK
jgi:antitoxin component YwqK of YwqJK toxin-antitoxin module